MLSQKNGSPLALADDEAILSLWYERGDNEH